ncbi:MAG TPA: anthranilate phosphoribosyltransferase [Candidatus Baltobacteraceae bacterium]|nr:anthranilate phosphoribosyltransferase [Candidatus Baltobacteraceae bacterium]
MEYAPLLRRLIAGERLTQDDAAAMMGAIMDGSFTPVQSAGLLTALAIEGEQTPQVIGAARAMRDRSLHVEHDLPMVVDVVGTGGDNANTINISTMTALVVAASGTPVAKHGNRAASSACGSADVLEAEGMVIDVEPERAAKMLRETGFTFMFAPRYHPAMKNVAPVRRELGVRTIFNVLGPLTNPARATHQVVGVARPELIELMGEVLRSLGVRAGAVVHASSGIDEVGGEGPTTVYTFDEGESRRWTLEPEAYGIRVPLEQIRGGSVDACKDAFERILSGEQSPRADVVALNAGLVFTVCKRTGDLKEGIELARTLMKEGRAAAVFERAKRFSHG